MADNTTSTKKQSAKTPVPPPPPPPGTDDDDVVQFDLTSDEGDGTSDLHVNLDEETNEEEKTVPVSSALDDEDVSFSIPTSKGSSAFSLDGDDLLNLFDRLQNEIEKESRLFEERQRQHEQNVLREKESMKREKIEFEEKKLKMLEGLERLKMKLSGDMPKSTSRRIA